MDDLSVELYDANEIITTEINNEDYIPDYQAHERERISNEQARITNESVRISNENIRISVEQQRNDNEIVRQSNESSRGSNEILRQQLYEEVNYKLSHGELKGETGITPNIQIGTVTAGNTPNVTRSGTDEEPILNFVLQKGDTGTAGYTPVKGTDYFTAEDIASLNIPDELSDLTSDSTHRTVTDTEKTAWNGKYDKPNGGIPVTDLTSTVQTSLGKADSALQSHQDISGKEDNTNKVTSISDSSTDMQYPSAKCVYESQAKQDTKIDWLQTLVNQMPTVSGQGTDLSLESVLNYRLMKFLSQGNSSQESTTGANILNNINYSLGNIDATGQDIPSGNTYRFNEYMPVNEQTTIYLLKRLVAVYYDENKEYLSQTSSGALTLTTPAGTRYARFRTFAGDFDTFNNADFMVSLSSITSYEPYTDGPAPNPSYPYPVKSVTGENSLAICGENLLNIEDGTYSTSSTDSRSITFKDGVGTPNFTSTSSALYIAVSCNLTLKAGTYTLQGFTNSSYPYIQLRNGTTIIVATVYGDNNKKTFTLSEDAKIDNVRFYYGSSLSNIGVVKPMIVKGENIPDVFTSYQEQNYQLSLGNIELNSSPDGTIRDYIYGTPDNWKKKQFIQKIILNGSESYGKNTSETGFISFTLSNYITSIDKDVSNNLFSNMLQSIASGNVANTCRIASSGRIVLTFSDTFCDYDLTALSTTLQTMYNNNNPVILYIPLATATDINITDTTLIGQLNDIYTNAHSYNGTTNITTTYEDGNEQIYLDIEALKNVWEVTE